MIWLIGSGLMSIDYAQVLDAHDCNYQVIGRGSQSAALFTEKTGKEVICGGILKYIDNTIEVAESAIVCVGVDQLYETTKQLIEAGVKKILIEKPGATSLNEIEILLKLSIKFGANIYIAYNRRFYSTTLNLIQRIEEDGGIKSLNFEFTEWGHIIEKLNKPKEVLNKWFLANSSHIADLAFFIGGKPKEIMCFTSGSLDWHPSSAVFSGAGITDKNALFNYCANWESAGRWAIEICTNENRYILKPLETLEVQRKGQIKSEIIKTNNEDDIKYKPGLFNQVKAFLSQDAKGLCSLLEQKEQFQIFMKIAGYN